MFKEGINNGISASDLIFFIEILGSRAMVKMSFNLINKSDANTECEYQLSFINFDSPILLSVIYDNQEKKTLINFHDKINIVAFDDAVCSNSFTTSLNRKNEVTPFLSLANFHPNTKVKICIQIQVPLFESFSDIFFTVPLIERYNGYLYPDYSIIINILNNDNLNLKKTQLEYNRQNHSHEIKNPYKIEASKITLKSPLILKIPKNKRINNIPTKYLKNTSDILFFIDFNLMQNKALSPLILNFIKIYGKAYKFNIILYGQHFSVLFPKMMDKNQQSISDAEFFLKSPNKTHHNINFNDAYTDLFGGKYEKTTKLMCPCIINKIKKVNIGDLNILNTVVICIGSHKSDDIIISKKVPTFLIDPSQIYDTHLFSLMNSFYYNGPILHDKESLTNAFTTVMQKIRIDNNVDECIEMIAKDDQDFYNEIDKFDKSQSFDSFKSFMFSKNLNLNMSIEKFNYLIDNIDINYDDVLIFLTQNQLDDVRENIKDNKQAFQILKLLMMIKAFGNDLIEKYYDFLNIKDNFKIIKLIKSIEKEQFIVFSDDDEATFNKNKYISLHRPLVVDNENEQKANCLPFKNEAVNKTANEPLIFYELFDHPTSKPPIEKKKKDSSKIKVIKLNSISESIKDTIGDDDDRIGYYDFFDEKELAPQINLVSVGLNRKIMLSS